MNQPSVMTPWELEHALDLLLHELDGSDPEVASALDQPVVELVRAWHSAWARFGDAPDGRDHFVALRDAADALFAVTAGAARLPNGVLAIEAMRQHALRAAVDSETNPQTAAPPAPSRRAAVPRIDRPVFVVSSPRSGSTLLFETLARARDLFTIGGESHRVIESVAGLHPRDRDWSSNRLVAADATSPRSPTRSGAASPSSCATATSSRPPNLRCACSRRPRRTRCACRSSRPCSPTLASSTSTATRARRSAACSTPGAPAASSPTRTCPDGASHRGRCCWCPAGATWSIDPWPRS